MIRQYDAQKICDDFLKKHPDEWTSLWSQNWRTNFSKSTKRLAECDHGNKRIIISILHLNSASEAEVTNTIKHEIAHALVGFGHGHDKVWEDKAISLGLSNPTPCGAMNIDQGRSTSEAEQKPKRELHRINSLCPKCGKIAKEKSHLNLNGALWTKLECGCLVKKDSIQSVESLSDSLENWRSQSGHRPFPYQIEGIKFIAANNGRVLIADEPALGKTIQAMGFIKFYSHQTCPYLWVCKGTLTIQAVKEFLEWCGIEYFPQVIKTSKDFLIPGLKGYIVSMDLLRRLPSGYFDSVGIKTVIADEVQHFKNPDSSRTAELRKLVNSADFFVPLSGTPWKNRGSEYFTVLNMLAPERFPSPAQFQNRWIDFYLNQHTGKYVMGGIRNIPAFREYTKDIVIRRMRADVLPELPKVYRQNRFVDLEQYAEIYNKEESKVAAAIKTALLEGKALNISSELMRLKHITGIAKAMPCVEDTIEFLEDSDNPEEKLVIFYHHLVVGNLLAQGDTKNSGIDKWLKDNNFEPVLKLDGASVNRENIVEKFRSNPKCRVMIASALAAGEGLNLQFCSNAYMLERQWNPANEEQCELRFSRPGAKFDSVNIKYYIAAESVDEILTDIVEKKRIGFRKTMNVGDEDLKYDESDILREIAEHIIKKRQGNKK